MDIQKMIETGKGPERDVSDYGNRYSQNQANDYPLKNVIAAPRRNVSNDSLS